MNDPTTPPEQEHTTSPRKEMSAAYAGAFLKSYAAQFDELSVSKETTFAIPTGEWDQFIVDNRFVSCVEVPQKGTAEWIKFRHDSNNIRYALNKAAGIGMHGEPEYTISNDKNGMLLVGTTAHILAVNFNQGMAAVKSLLDNKGNGAAKSVDHLKKIKHTLPLHIQAQVSMLEPTLKRAVATLTNVLNGYSEDVRDVYTAAEEFKGRTKIAAPQQIENTRLDAPE